MQTPVNPLSLPRFFTLAVAAALTLGTTPVHAALPQAVQWSQAQIVSADLQIQHLAPGAYRQTFQASATVQSPAALLRNLSALDMARARLAAARSSLRLAQLQAQRAQGLFQAGQNIALAEVQQAQTAAQTAQAQVAVAQATLQAAQAELTASLGPALAARLQTVPALRSAIASGRELIVDLTLPPGTDLPAAAQVRLHVPGGSGELRDGWLPATVIGPAAAASAHVQGLRFVATSPAASGLMPGLQLLAQVQSGQAQQGVLLPAGAVVWSGGQALVFTSTPAANNARRFTPHALSTAWPLQAGYMQPGWAALDVVTHGAGLLLTPPPKPQAKPAAHDTTAGDDD
ncbi:MAG: efflux RND transporter periplasmic adaptor subunit [Thiomonas sp.]